jgi:hypothetical protein
VRVSYGRNQGQAQPAAGITRPLPAGETLECALRYLAREAAALVGHVQSEQLPVIAGGQRDRATAVMERVGDEVVQRLRCAIGVTEQPAAGRHVPDHNLPASYPGGSTRTGHGRFKQHSRLQRPRPQRKLPVVGLREHQDVVGQPAHAADLLRRRPQRSPELAGIPVAGQRELDFRAQGGQRRPQLMACVDQLPLFLLLARIRHAAGSEAERLAGLGCNSHLSPDG